jgi:hypothetical protein
MLKGDVICLAQRERPSEPSATTANHASRTFGTTEATRSTQAKLQATTRRDERTTMTNGRGGDGRAQRRRTARGRLRRRSLDEGVTRPTRDLTTWSRGRRRRRGCSGSLDKPRAANAIGLTEGRTPRRSGTTGGRRRRRPGPARRRRGQPAAAAQR